MLAILFVIFFTVNFIKNSIDSNFGCYKLRYEDSYVHINELIFSFVTNVCLIILYAFAYFLCSSEFNFLTLEFNIAILILKLNQCKKTVGSKILYCMYIILLMLIQSLNEIKLRDSTIRYTLAGALFLLIPEPIRSVKILLNALNRDNNNRIWHYVANIVNFVSSYIDFMFHIVINPLYCFVFIRTVSNPYIAAIAFTINVVSGTMVLIDKLHRYPDILSRCKKYLPIY